jgi:uncharacterized protein involved in response to NO
MWGVGLIAHGIGESTTVVGAVLGLHEIGVGAIGGYILGLFLQLPLIYNIIGSGLTVIAGTIGAVTGMHATQRNTKGEKSDD